MTPEIRSLIRSRAVPALPTKQAVIDRLIRIASDEASRDGDVLRACRVLIRMTRLWLERVDAEIRAGTRELRERIRRLEAAPRAADGPTAPTVPAIAGTGVQTGVPDRPARAA